MARWRTLSPSRCSRRSSSPCSASGSDPPAAPNHAWPWSFVLFYVLPVGAMFVGSLVAAVRGSEPWTISGTAAGVLLGMVWISSLVALLSLVMAARVRAAWQRARASGAV